jgi:hypothetical protein
LFIHAHAGAPSKTRPSEQPAKADVQKSSTAATAMPRKVSSVSFDDPDLPVVKRTKLEAKEESTSVLGDLNLRRVPALISVDY